MPTSVMQKKKTKKEYIYGFVFLFFFSIYLPKSKG